MVVNGGWEKSFPGYDRHQMFELISGFDAYPHFVPGCLEARVLEREVETALRLETVFGVGPTRFSFTSQAILDPPVSLHIASTDGPWRDFRLSWTLTPEEAGCRIGCQYSARFRSWLVASAARMGMADLDRHIAAVLETRAQAVFGVAG